jgi:hypothetical protein
VVAFPFRFCQSWASFLPYGYHPRPDGKYKKDGSKFQRPGEDKVEKAKGEWFAFAVKHLKIGESWYKATHPVDVVEDEDLAGSGGEDGEPVGDENGGEPVGDEDGGAHFAQWSFSDRDSGDWPFGNTGADLVIADAVYGQPGEVLKYSYGPPDGEPARAWGKHEFEALFKVHGPY